MRGLLVKDFLVLKKQLKFFLIAMVLWSLTPGLSSHAFATLFSAMLPITAIAYDERSKWNAFAAMMPYSPRNIVFEKYILGYIIMAAFFVMSIISNFIFSFVYPHASSNYTNSAVLIMPMCAALLMIAFVLPIVFKIGVEKARIALMICVGVFTAVMTLLGASSKFSADILSKLSGTGFSLIMIFTAAAANIISVPVAVRCFKNKE